MLPEDLLRLLRFDLDLRLHLLLTLDLTQPYLQFLLLLQLHQVVSGNHGGCLLRVLVEDVFDEGLIDLRRGVLRIVQLVHLQLSA